MGHMVTARMVSGRKVEKSMLVPPPRFCEGRSNVVQQLLLARTNLPNYPAQGSNFVSSSLLYGPLPAVDNNEVLQANLMSQLDGWVEMKRSGFNAG